MDKKVEKFKSDFKDLNARVKLIKKKLEEAGAKVELK